MLNIKRRAETRGIQYWNIKLQSGIFVYLAMFEIRLLKHQSERKKRRYNNDNDDDDDNNTFF